MRHRSTLFTFFDNFTLFTFFDKFTLFTFLDNFPFFTSQTTNEAFSHYKKVSFSSFEDGEDAEKYSGVIIAEHLQAQICVQSLSQLQEMCVCVCACACAGVGVGVGVDCLHAHPVTGDFGTNCTIVTFMHSHQSTCCSWH